MNVRNARISDVKAIHALISSYAERDRMLFRSIADIYEKLQTFIVAELDGGVVGCCGLEIIWSDLAEIKSLAVDAAKKADISVSLCGEMAGDPLCAYILLGLDLVEVSMNPNSIPLIKSVIRSISVEKARLDVENILRLTTAGDVQKYVLDRMKSIAPELLKKGYLNE